MPDASLSPRDPAPEPDMVDFLHAETAPFGAATGRVRLRTFILLRWLAVAGQTAAVVFVSAWLGLQVDVVWCAVLIGASALLNLVLMLTLPSQRLMKEWEAAGQVGFDILQLTGLLAVTGGADNPFMLLLIAPVAVSATALRPGITAVLVGFTILCVLFLAHVSEPLPWFAGQTFELPELYRVGLILAVGVGLLFTAVYAWRVAEEEHRLVTALAAAQIVLAREQRLSSLGGLAAAAAHELGTPLATIHLVAAEMARSLHPDDPLLEDAQLLVSQTQRCRDILSTLSSRGESGDSLMLSTPINALLEEIAGPHRGLGPRVEVHAAPFEGSTAPPPTVLRSPEVRHGIGNLVENAIGFASSRVDIIARWSASEIEIVVRDDGHGFMLDVLPRLGEPYISDRPKSEARAGGLGLGVFIAKTLLERSGGQVSFRNRSAPESGAVVRVVWSRERLERDEVGKRGQTSISRATAVMRAN
jgi:two-component system sensor histidine kinase RegB